MRNHAPRWICDAYLFHTFWGLLSLWINTDNSYVNIGVFHHFYPLFPQTRMMMIPMTETGGTAKKIASHRETASLKIRLVLGRFLNMYIYTADTFLLCFYTRRRSRWSRITRSCSWRLCTLTRATVVICWKGTWRRSCTRWDCTFHVRRWTNCTHSYLQSSLLVLWIHY